MKTKIIMLLVVCSLFVGKVNAQWVVSDPGNLAQGIINASKNIIQTSSTAATWRKGLSMRQRTSFRLLRPHRI